MLIILKFINVHRLSMYRDRGSHTWVCISSNTIMIWTADSDDILGIKLFGCYLVIFIKPLAIKWRVQFSKKYTEKLLERSRWHTARDGAKLSLVACRPFLSPSQEDDRALLTTMGRLGFQSILMVLVLSDFIFHLKVASIPVPGHTGSLSSPSRSRRS